MQNTRPVNIAAQHRALSVRMCCQLGNRGHAQRPIARVLTVGGCAAATVERLEHIGEDSQRPRADLNRDRWIQSPEC